MKTINIRKDQLQEVTVAGDVRPGENLGSAAKRTVKDANSELGSNKVDGVSFSSDEILSFAPRLYIERLWAINLSKFIFIILKFNINRFISI